MTRATLRRGAVRTVHSAPDSIPIVAEALDALSGRSRHRGAAPSINRHAGLGHTPLPYFRMLNATCGTRTGPRPLHLGRRQPRQVTRARCTGRRGPIIGSPNRVKLPSITGGKPCDALDLYIGSALPSTMTMPKVQRMTTDYKGTWVRLPNGHTVMRRHLQMYEAHQASGSYAEVADSLGVSRQYVGECVRGVKRTLARVMDASHAEMHGG